MIGLSRDYPRIMKQNNPINFGLFSLTLQMILENIFIGFAEHLEAKVKINLLCKRVLSNDFQRIYQKLSRDNLDINQEFLIWIVQFDPPDDPRVFTFILRSAR